MGARFIWNTVNIVFKINKYDYVISLVTKDPVFSETPHLIHDNAYE